MNPETIPNSSLTLSDSLSLNESQQGLSFGNYNDKINYINKSFTS